MPVATVKRYYEVEVQDTSERFRFRLLCKRKMADGSERHSASAWCGYNEIARLGNKYAGSESNNIPKDKAFKPVNAHVIASAIAKRNQ